MPSSIISLPLKNLPLAASCIVALWLSPCALAVPSYVIYDLGTLGAPSSEAFSINDSGQVTGSSNHADGPDRHAFIYSGGPLIDLGTLGGTSSIGFGINNLGQVTGTSTINRFDADAFLYSGGILTNIGTPLGNSIAYSINDAGQVAGFRSSGGSADYHAFIRTGGIYQDLPNLGAGNSFATAINQAGAAAGYSGLAGSGFEHAFLYENSVTLDLGTLGGNNSEGWAINASKQVAGQSQVADTSIHAFIGSASGLVDLGTLGGLNSFGRGINDAGEVVGSSDLGSGGQHPFLYSGGSLYDLNDLATNLGAAGFSSLNHASDINNQGWIVGSGSTIHGDGHAFLAILVPATVPETGSLIFYLPCLLLLLRHGRRASVRSGS